MTGWFAAWLVAEREVRARARTRVFLIGTGLIVLLAAGGVIAASELPAVFEDEPPTLLVVEQGAPPGILAAARGAATVAPEEIRVASAASAEQAEQALRSEQADAALVGEELLFREDPDATLEAVATRALFTSQVAERLRDLGVPPEQAGGLLQPPSLQVRSLDAAQPAAEEETTEEEGFVAFLSVLALLMALTLYGNWILTGVVEEKTTRVVEVLLGVVQPAQLLVGKVVGIVLLGIAQIAIGAVAATAAILAFGAADLPEVSLRLVPFLVLWVLLGLAFYSFAYAAVGSTVARQEDASNVALPLTMVLMGSYFLATFVVIGDPDGVAARVATFIPLTAPLIVPPRVAVTEVPWWEVGVSIALMLVAIVLMVRLAARIYSGAILRTGQRIRLFDALRAERPPF